MNRLTLAVAGGRKTQSIVDSCCSAPREGRILVLTYTQANQQELRERLALFGPQACTVHVQGWFSFLLGHWIRPYLPRLFQGDRLRGLNFDGDPGRFATGRRRFLDDEQRAYKRHLAHLAHDVNRAAAGAAIDRLSRLYDTIHVDEVQDLNGWDLEILAELMDSPIRVELVGDIRQAILYTNVEDQKNSQYKGTKVIDWFRKQEAAHLLEMDYQSVTWRSIQLIADLADSAFDASWGFPPTKSQAGAPGGHSGVYTVAASSAVAYAERFNALCLRSKANSGTCLELPYINIGQAKGMEAEHVLLWPTGTMLDFIQKAKPLKSGTACALYVAVTRARASVALITDKRLPGFLPWAS
jgi:ATP-dependent DNA helicase UvrD/PcrA